MVEPVVDANAGPTEDGSGECEMDVVAAERGMDDDWGLTWEAASDNRESAPRGALSAWTCWCDMVVGGGSQERYIKGGNSWVALYLPGRSKVVNNEKRCYACSITGEA